MRSAKVRTRQFQQLNGAADAYAFDVVQTVVPENKFVAAFDLRHNWILFLDCYSVK